MLKQIIFIFLFFAIHVSFAQKISDNPGTQIPAKIFETKKDEKKEAQLLKDKLSTQESFEKYLNDAVGDPGHGEVNGFLEALAKLHAAAKNTNAISASGGMVSITENYYVSVENGKPMSNGFYVVIGTFGNKENADRFRAANVMKGHLNTKIIQNRTTKVYNIFVLKSNNKADANAEKLKYKAEYPDAWILKLK